ncbi:hypothetical protein OWM54_08235 [Myxococcus sp. MISCRS1]|uniref:hypothetical protein n=1 Tax=Myxococcus sp. MISCRS1 TaxID=2996786 RepID=UPI00227102BD|nr:hypothetical protein [Myxococcus sp. MISCRS1]MCY0997131.1 hypothetical protein [Myxococcus sp. MISCRS1]
MTVSVAMLTGLHKKSAAQSAAGSGSAPTSKARKKAVGKSPKEAAAAAEPCAPSKLTALQQKKMDEPYRNLDIPHLDLLVRSANQNGLGDLINGLQTCRMLMVGTKWTVAIDSNHPDLATMLSSFAGVEKGALEDEYHEVALETPGMVGTKDRLVVTEYGYRTARELNEYTRSSGLREHEIGIMSNLALRQPLALSKLDLSQPHLREVLPKHGQEWRFFFGYGAGQKERARYDLLLDRVIFDPSITQAIVLPVNHHTVGEDSKKSRLGITYLERYLAQRKGPLAQLKRGKAVEFDTLTVETLSLGNRVFKVVAMKPKQVIAYSDMQQLWRAADRSFTIAEGDQSFSEAISAGIPMAYQLWRSKGTAHKQALYDSFVKQAGNIAEFIIRCANYPENELNPGELAKIIEDCNSKQFLTQYSEFAAGLAETYDIAPRLRGFVKRYWVRMNRHALAQEFPVFGEKFGGISALEAAGRFDEAYAKTLDMLGSCGVHLGPFNARRKKFGRQGAIKAGIGESLERQAMPREVFALIYQYDDSDFSEGQPSAPPAGATGASTATAAAGTAPVRASAAAAAGVAPAAPKPPTS